MKEFTENDLIAAYKTMFEFYKLHPDLHGADPEKVVTFIKQMPDGEVYEKALVTIGQNAIKQNPSIIPHLRAKDGRCLHCGEDIKPHERVGHELFHRECMVRNFVGSVAHQRQKCSCYGGNGEDDPKLTTRQNAQAALECYFLFQKNAYTARNN